MKNVTLKFALLTLRAVWASLIICICLIGGSATAFGQEGKPEIVPDNTYGKGGTKETFTEDEKDETGQVVGKKVTVKFKNFDGVVRENRVTTTLRPGANPFGTSKVEQIDIYHCAEKGFPQSRLAYRKVVITGSDGEEVSYREERYDKRSNLLSGYYRRVNDDGKKIVERYNPKTRQREEIALDSAPSSSEISLPSPDSACPEDDDGFQANEIALGFSLIREDSDPEDFNTYGVDASYTRFVTEQVGVRGSFNAHFRERGGVELSKISVLGGIKVLPFERATTEDRATVFTHALFGISRFKADFGPNTFTENSFTAKLGGGFDVNVTRNFFIRPAEVSYAPTFYGDATQHNFQVGFGAGVRWK